MLYRLNSKMPFACRGLLAIKIDGFFYTLDKPKHAHEEVEHVWVDSTYSISGVVYSPLGFDTDQSYRCVRHGGWYCDEYQERLLVAGVEFVHTHDTHKHHHGVALQFVSNSDNPSGSLLVGVERVESLKNDYDDAETILLDDHEKDCFPDSTAEYMAEEEREYNERWNLCAELADLYSELRERFAARNNVGRGFREVRENVTDIREKLKNVRSDFPMDEHFSDIPKTLEAVL